VLLLAEKRFGHYELVTGEDGKPVERGRGAASARNTNSTHKGNMYIAELPASCCCSAISIHS
jgi:hypothetical protein